ncbi:MAG: class I mannose-6-phosphate isomerase [Bacteroidales bacterium]|nr:class I mannose-6-phosphate isomerase [Bacteroidales bacterium]
MLYPIKFEPIFFEKIWGGSRLRSILNKNTISNKIGESWEISAVEDNISLVAEGFLKGNSLTELVEVYMGDLVGEKVYQKYGLEFPLLIKFIDAHDDLSIQVHPNDEVAKDRHHAWGKTEMWYVVDAEPDSYIYLGFNKDLSKEEFLNHLNHNTITAVLNKIPARKGDVFFIPAGRIHAIGKGVLLAEIQQTSDITYRVYDWNRKDEKGNPRELHIEEALDVIDYSKTSDLKIEYENQKNVSIELINCPYFTTNLFDMNQSIDREYIQIDSFKIWLFIKGEGYVKYNETQIKYNKGDVYLIPSEIHEISLIPANETIALEVYLNQ